MALKKEVHVRPEDMGHKNPSLHELNMRARKEDRENAALYGGAVEEARKAFVGKFASGLMRRTQKNVRPPL